MQFLSALRHFILYEQLIPNRARIVVGVSGGPDSLALLHALGSLASEHGWQLHAAYLNHGLRPEAEMEAHFVAEIAAAQGHGCTIERADVRAIAAQPGVSLEEAARQARYAFLGRVALRQGAEIVAVGHHADDQVETVFMHLLRGSGLAGLRGMMPDTPLAGLRLGALPAEDRSDFGNIRLIRPLLSFSRTQILAYCQKNGLQPFWDASNTDETFFRNRLRHDIIPQLKTINPNLTTVVGRMTKVLRGDCEVLDAHRRQLWQTLARSEPGRVRLDLALFRTLSSGDQRAMLRRAIAVLRPEHRNVSLDHTERILEALAADPQRASGGPLTLTSGLTAWLSYHWLDIQEADFIAKDVPQIFHPTPLSLPGEVMLGPSWRLKARKVGWAHGETPPWHEQQAHHVIWLPSDTSLPLLVRPRHPGDRMRPFGLNAIKTIKDLMNEHKIPRSIRKHWPLVLDGNDRIVWLVGYRASECTHLAPDTTRAWEVSLQSDVD